MSRARQLLLTTTALVPLLAAGASAGPQGPNVVGGTATVQGAGTANVVVNQSSQKAIINWHMFNIGVGESTTFNNAHGASGVTLNRVTGGMGPSEILGSLTSNGKVFIVNRDGFIFGAGSVVNTAGFLATTHDIKNEDFMAGRYNFDIKGRPDASIVNLGTITAHSGGFAALVAPGVRNAGTITATLSADGTGNNAVGLAASGQGFALDPYGDKLIKLGVNDHVAGQVIDVATGQPLNSLVTNTGKLSANGGRVEITAAAARHIVDSVINTSGVIEANTVGTRGGQIILGAATASTKGAGAPKQTVKVSGKLSVSGKNSGEKGGKVQVTGEHIQVAGATIDASGKAGGGKVLIGGDWGGGHKTAAVNNPSAHLENGAVPTATTVSVDAATTIDASATEGGNGGKIILWSDDFTSFSGRILALGGPNLGSGGFVEVSGHQLLEYRGTADLRAANGAAGTLLLDPFDVLITGTGSTGPGSWSTGTWTPSGTSVITTADLMFQLGLGNVIITTNGSGSDAGNITVASSFGWTGNNSLSLVAHNNITIYDNVTITHSGTGTGNLNLRADSLGTGTGTIVFNQWTMGARVDFTNSSGKVNFYYNPSSYVTPTDYTPTGQGGGRGVLTNTAVPKQFHAYMLVNNQTDLANVATNVAGTYALGKDIFTTGLFTPIGYAGGPFLGTFDGQGSVIHNLSIAPNISGLDTIGLFTELGSTGVVRNLTLSGVTVSSNPAVTSLQYIGAVAGRSWGTIENVSVVDSSTVSGGSAAGSMVGGLVGLNAGTIGNSVSGATVDGSGIVGGLVGLNTGLIQGSSTLLGADVTGNGATYIGGLVGENDGSISSSFAQGNVSAGMTGSSLLFVGGLVGLNDGSISASHATGTVTGTGGTQRIGGLVGASNTTSASITNSHAQGTVSSNTSLLANVGGLAGLSAGTITNSYATGGVSSTSALAETGGLVGWNEATGVVTASHATGAVSGNGKALGGLVGVNDNDIINSYAMGTVSTTTAGWVGGLIGRNNAAGTIAGSNATGNVSVSSTGSPDFFAGGLVGINLGGITTSHATGIVTGNGGDLYLGGLVGSNETGASIAGSWATGAVNMTNTTYGFAGGLVGASEGSITTSNATGAVTKNGSGGASVGGLVGETASSATITGSHATGHVTVSTTGGVPTFAGGLVGVSYGSIQTSYASGNVKSLTGQVWLGGLAGLSLGSITGSHATGDVTVVTTSALTAAGGLIGESSGYVTNSYATGNVNVTQTGSFDVWAGGLIGRSFVNVTDSYASGNVTVSGGYGKVGGLVGLLNSGATIDDSHASGVVTYSTADFGHAGGLVGWSYGTITDSWASGAVSIAGTATASAGGLVGWNDGGSIGNSHATGNVSGDGLAIGGLVGWNDGILTTTYATGAVSGHAQSLGGLVGYNDSAIYNSYATGAVTNSGSAFEIGGFVGMNAGSIDSSHATGAMYAANGIGGGFAGANVGSINNSYATGAVTGDVGAMLGGFAGFNYHGGPGFAGLIESSYSTSSVNGGIVSGGFVGINAGTIDRAYATGAVTTGDGGIAGGFAGANYFDTGNGVGTISRAYATGAVTTGQNGFAGGFAAINAGGLDQVYAAGLVTAGAGSFTGGLAAFDGYSLPTSYTPPFTPASTPGTATNSYWDTGTTGQTTSAGGTGLSTAQMTAALPAGFSTSDWAINPNTSYPYLSISTPIPTPGPYTPPPPPPHGHDHDAGCGGDNQSACVPPTQLPVLVQTDDPTPVATPEVVNTAALTAPPPPAPPSGSPPQQPRRVSGVPPRNETRFINNEVVLQLANNVSPEQLAAIAKELGIVVISSENVGLLARTVYRFQITNGKSVADIIRGLERKNITAFAQPNYVYTLTQGASAQPSGQPAPETSAQETASVSHTHGDSEQYTITKMRLPETHAISRGSNVLVAVIDSAVDPNHPDLKDAIADRLNTIEGEVKPHMHGTGMAGAIASQRRLLGVAPRSRLLTISAFGGKAQTAESTSMQIVKGLNWAVEKGARVINMSFAGPHDPILAQAMKTMHDRGIVMIAAAGNAGPGSPPLFPAADPNVIAVTATDVQDKVFARANRGKHIALAAPGVDVLVPAPEGSYQLTTGTSVAAAHISGVAALLLERNPNLKPADIRQVLIGTAKKQVGAKPEDIGSGLVDPYQALQRSGRSAGVN